MKSFKAFLLFLFISINFCKAQDTTLLLSPAMFGKTTGQIFIAAKDGWFFKEGNDTAWARKDIDVTGWKKMKPTELSAKLADKNGKVEGWFRIKIKLDESFKSIPLGLNIGSWAASDVYLDGQWLGSTGNTGSNGAPFKENRFSNGKPIQINLSPGKEYTIALHVVDYLSPFPPARLKSEEPGINGIIPLITLTEPKFISVREQQIIKENIYQAIWVAVCAVLSFLFWLLYTQNTKEKNLLMIALSVSFLTLNICCNIATSNDLGLSYVNYQLIFYGSAFFATLSFMIIPLILAYAFKGKVSIYLKIFLIGFFIVYFISSCLWLESIIITASTFMLYAVCIYYVISSWKNLRGAQWAIVAGLMLMLFSLVIFAINSDGTLKSSFALLYVTGIYLSFPLGLLVYVSFRFKEIMKEVRENAQQVLQLSEEKKEHALHQQEILQGEVNRQTAEIRATLDNLKSTQKQLIQSEKMASLGELTAGIAHEIQNPLNFVNNFSELSTELIDEMKQELSKANYEDANAIADDLKQNLEKINHHGKRAGDIVKGMLQHSRKSSGQKEPTDINALCDEYLRLTYQGLRAKDKEFNATMKTNFDENIGKINIIPQDIGRVLLNLYNNAFYAVLQKQKEAAEQGLPTFERLATLYEPTVSVSTKKSESHVLITVSDNGGGIPQNIANKIFQPFFTTKPTGSGTGLGLSLSYDIVKAHGGGIKVESKEGEGSEFIISIPQ